MADLTIVGGGLAGCEAAWQVASRGYQVDLFEMRPIKSTGAHITSNLAELVCSNSLGSNLPDRASGLLKNELRRLDSLLLKIADQCALPAGGALAVDRDRFGQQVTQAISDHANIRLIREEVQSIPSGPVIIASGPLTSPALAASITQLTGSDHLFFFDAIAPIIRADSIDMQIAYRASRYEKAEEVDGDYINCPMEREEYEQFVTALVQAERIPLRDFESEISAGVKAGAGIFFEGCLPVEIIASRETKALAFGPMRPVGLWNPLTGKRPYAVLQLRQDNLAGTLYNMVGFQTNLTFPEQKRIFRMIPGLEHAEFERYGQMHRNTFIASPLMLNPSLQLKSDARIFFAGQITGVEGYMGNIATGLLAGLNAARMLEGKDTVVPPPACMLGALCAYITGAEIKHFQPMKANFGILPDLPSPASAKRERAAQYATRALETLEQWITGLGIV
ncbi:MAG: methylenetetrahydrofolate--tRNA-(uracil(54)-C(5))-methyltransferase (FADH(2)-oxidizing) TrmFO [Anaerolineae bacterium]|nr:methylenetetrahydrofolate--tRNA-(uracil(54)-C(5))-methyltransferase (FADH(2)-oxidizing) TrmFO [Anaerolineae bacterium]